MKGDIQTFDDIKLLVQSFYSKAQYDDTIGYFFTEVMEIDWENHFPRMYQFWESVLLGKATYKGNPMLKHIALHRKEALTDEHFERWIRIWNETVDLHFEGVIADKAKSRACSIKDLMKFKVGQVSDV